MKIRKALYIIPARGGSKGIPYKNIKLLNGIPLIGYTLELAKKVCADGNHICVSTDSTEIAKVAEQYGINMPFLRPKELSTDSATTRDVIIHALNFYKKERNEEFEIVVLLQPTSPFRKEKHVIEAVERFSPEIDMVVSVKESHENPYCTLYEADNNGYLIQSKDIGATRRQDCPPVFAMNGSIYVIDAKLILEKDFSQFKKVAPYLMEDVYSVDIDTPLDWLYCEMLLQNNLV